ncbi:MAG: TonB-dependent receptor [Bacteroidota bacterium]|nr:TonB-dependent receptor [Bacteroidota bacterium]MEC8400166.1 TonB-dependent receptor [Bacteroidota bacterium]HCL45664.1 SusC/RagA family TonB-linked outer membrane protein [Flavobacteriales bacterium]
MIQRISSLMALVLFFGASSGLWAQTISVGGTVVDGDMPLPGVSVTVKGAYAGTATDLDGKFALTAESGATVVFSYIGYLRKELTVANTVADLKVVLQPDVAGLEEAVVIGYGNQQRSKISGAVTTVDIKEATSIPVLRTEQALQGRAAGVQVTQNSGQPGSTQTIRIRGLGSINNSDPLFIVDGIPSGGIDYLNPSDIESISILKDAASTAIYGARGANGVVLITTKKGSRGSKATLTYDSYVGMQEPWKFMALLNAAEYATLMNESRAAAGLAALPGLTDPASLGQGTNWQEAMFQRAPMSNHSVLYTKGTETSSMAMGASHFSQDGIIGGEKGRFERTTFRVNSEQQAGDRIKVGQNVTFTNINRSALAVNNEFATPVVRALNMDPVTPVTRPDGQYAYTDYIDSDIVNPINQIEQTYDNWTTNRFVGNVFGEMDLTPNLTFRSSVNVDLALGSQNIFLPAYDLALFPGDPNRPATEFREVNSLIRAENKWSTWQWENTLTYSKEFKNDDKLQVIAGYSALESRSTSITASRDSLATNDPTYAFLSNSLNVEPQIPRASDGISETAWIGQFVRATYDLGKEWSLMGTLRYDGSSRFGLNNRFGLFPSFSAAWNLTERPWFDEKDWIDFFKVRGSWGRNGNAEIGDYAYNPVIVNGLNYTLGQEQTQIIGSGPVAIANPDLKWETGEQINFGVDADFLDGRWNLIFDIYEKNTIDMLAYVPNPGTAGLDPGPSNVASASNRGAELAVGYQGGEGDFTYNLNGNISAYRNEVTDLGAPVDSLNQPIYTGNVFGSGDFVAITDIGLPIATFWGFETAGIYQTDEEAMADTSQVNAVAGDVIFVDQNGDGVINNEDKVVIGNPHPDFTYGFTAGAKYRNFDVTLFLQGSHGNDIYKGMFRYDLNTTNLPTSALDRWTGEGSTNEAPRVTHADLNQNNRVSDRFIEDGSYLRVKSLMVGYTLPSEILDRVGISKFRIYASANNLFTLTKYTGLDPEIGTRGTLEIGIDRGFYPSPRIYNLGINVTF